VIIEEFSISKNHKLNKNYNLSINSNEKKVINQHESPPSIYFLRESTIIACNIFPSLSNPIAYKRSENLVYLFI